MIGRGLRVNFGSLGLDLGNIRGSISRVRGFDWERFEGQFGQFKASLEEVWGSIWRVLGLIGRGSRIDLGSSGKIG